MTLLIALSLWGRLEAWDKAAFLRINRSWTNPFLDGVMPYLRDPVYWAPLYLFLLVLVLLNYRGKGGWWAILFICTVAITDMVSSKLFKDVFERLRPCQDPDFIMYVRLLVQSCSKSPSFTSNHAANHFGMATFFYVTFRHLIPKWAILAFAWAAAISYAQVYVGVHYPLDVVGGACIGILFGLVTGMFFNKKFGFTTFGTQPTG